MNEVEITKNLPLPPNRAKKYPLSDLEVGDSFGVNTDKERSLRSVVSAYKKVHPNKNFAVKRIEGGIRCWRVK